MKKTGFGFVLLALSVCFIAHCGGGGGDSGGGTGTLSITIADAKPALPVEDIDQVLVTIDEVQVHGSGSGWMQLQLSNGKQEYEVDLLQFINGNVTALVSLVSLPAGKYTQIRFGVKTAAMVTKSGTEIPLEIPSENLKTDKNFEFDLAGGGSVALTFDFDLSQSIVATGAGKYALKPVLHIVKTPTLIKGNLSASTFGADHEAVVVVTRDNNNNSSVDPADEEYTRVIVSKAANPTPFAIYWVVPDTQYIVQILVNNVEVYKEVIAAANLPEGAEYTLNDGNPV